MELESLSLIDLRNLAKAKGISNVSKLKKSELIEKILELSSDSEQKPVLEEKESEEIITDDLSDNSYSVG